MAHVAVMDVRVAGLQVAEIELVQSYKDGGLTQIELSMANRGLAKLFAGRHRHRLMAEYASANDGFPARFVSKHEKPDRTRIVTLTIGPDGGITSVVVNNDGREGETDVPQDLWQGTLDPLTSLLRLQQYAMSRIGGDLEIALFDGRKRLDLTAKRSTAAMTLLVKFEAVFGFDESDEFVSWPGQAEKWFELAFDLKSPPLPASLRSQAPGTTTEVLQTGRRQLAL